MENSAIFYRDVMKSFNFSWFAAHGSNPNNLRTYTSPSIGYQNYGNMVYGSTPQENKMYNESEQFRSWCDKSATPYDSCHLIVFEYVIRAHQTLYTTENVRVNLENELTLHKSDGFAYIDETYSLVAGK